MSRKCTEISFMDALSMTNNFCPIKIYYNNKLVWDDDLSESEGWMLLSEAIEKFKAKHPEWQQIMIHTIKVDIVSFHHSIIHLKGKRVKPYEEV
jgi:hypothetical protein